MKYNFVLQVLVLLNMCLVYFSKALNMTLMFGAHDISIKEKSQVRTWSSEFIIYEKYEHPTLKNDIALVKLPNPIKETNEIQIIQIRTDNRTYDGSEAIISGWGATANDQSYPKKLRYATVEVISDKDCKRHFSRFTPTNICTRGKDGSGGCFGDSGGPMTIDAELVGVVSFGDQDCGSGTTVYTRLSKYKEWLEDNSDIEF